jgi:hypothetical protein
MQFSAGFGMNNDIFIGNNAEFGGGVYAAFNVGGMGSGF